MYLGLYAGMQSPLSADYDINYCWFASGVSVHSAYSIYDVQI